MNRDSLPVLLNKTLGEADLSLIRFEDLKNLNRRPKFRRGKVRDIVDFGNTILILTTDRISAFDRVLTTIPCKGEVLNRISLFWFRKTEDIVRNHVVAETSPRSVLAKKCRVIPIEVVVRGYLTGSAWRNYERGESISGIRLEPGLRFNQKLANPIITPSTKEEQGDHDRPLSREDILKDKLVSEEIWLSVEKASFELFKRGSDLVREQGLILVDTKYEFGLDGDELYLIDEIHTPDSSRYWYADSYEENFAKGRNQNELDKEYFRRWLMNNGFSGDGPAPSITDEIRLEVAERYTRAYEEITGLNFCPSSSDVASELELIAERLVNTTELWRS